MIVFALLFVCGLYVGSLLTALALRLEAKTATLRERNVVIEHMRGAAEELRDLDRDDAHNAVLILAASIIRGDHHVAVSEEDAHV